MGRITVDSALVMRARMDIPEAWDKLMAIFYKDPESSDRKPIQTMAWKYADNYHDAEHLMGAGLEELFISVNEWHPVKNPNFAGYAMPRIKGYISTVWFEEMGPAKIPKKTQQRYAKVQKVFQDTKDLRLAVEKYNASVAYTERVKFETMLNLYNLKNIKEVTEYE